MPSIQLDESTSAEARELLDHLRKADKALQGIVAHLPVMAGMTVGEPAEIDYDLIAMRYSVQGADATEKAALATLMYNELNAVNGNSGALRQFIAWVRTKTGVTSLS